MGLRHRLAAPLRLAGAGFAAAPSRWLLPSAGIAVAVALMGTATGGGAVAGELAAQRLLAGLPDAERHVRVTWSGGLPAGVETRALRELTSISPAPRTSSVLLAPSRVGPARTLVQVAGVEPLSRWVELDSGRLPRSCTPLRCEVLEVGGPRVGRALRGENVHLVPVGRARLRSTVPLGFLPRPVLAGQSEQQRQPPLLVSGDPGGLESLEGLSSVFRTHTWASLLDTGSTPSWRFDEVAARVRRARAALEGAESGYTVTSPLGALAQAGERASRASGRVVLVAGGAAALLAAFVLLAAGAQRRELRAEVERLQRHGARTWQVGALRAAAALAPALAGVVAGAGMALAVSALRARAAGIPAGPLLEHTLIGGQGVAGALACWAIAAALLAAGAAWSPGSGRAGDVVALAATGALALALSRGGVSAQDIGRGADPLPALLPALACLVAGLVVLRATIPLLRGGARLARRAPAALRLALLGLARAPRQPALTVAFLTVAGGLALFAATYHATLRNSQADEAAFRVPADVTVAPGQDFVRPLDLMPAERWQALTGPGGEVFPIVRAQASVPAAAHRAAIPVLGVPSAALAAIHGWRDQDASAPRGELAADLRGRGDTELAGAPLPAGAAVLSVPARTRGDRLTLTAALAYPDGEVRRVPLGSAGPVRRVLRGPVPALAGARLVAIGAEPGSDLLATRGHNLAENPATPGTIGGRLELGPVRADGRPVDDLGRWKGFGPLREPARSDGGITVPYAFDRPGVALLRPAQPTDGRELPVLTDRVTARGAAPGGRLALSVDGIAVAGRIVGTAERFPAVGEGAAGFIVADGSRLATVLHAARPGAGAASDLWLAVAPGEPAAALEAALSRPPLTGLAVSERRALQAQLEGDPLAAELLRTLTVAAIAALVLVIAGLLLATVAALREERAELFDLEAQGFEPAALRRNLRLRATLLGGLGTIGGVALGVVLGALVVDALQATAASTAPRPPLVAVTPWGVTALAALAVAVVAAAAVWAVTRRAFAQPVPRPAPRVAP